MNIQVVVCLAVLLAAGCTSSKTTTGMQPVENPPDMPILPPAAETGESPQEEPAQSPSFPETATDLPAAAPPAEAAAELPGADTAWVSLAEQSERSAVQAQYRVQIFASRSLASVRQVVSRARALQGDPVRIVTTETLYKVHVGDYPDRESAQQQRNRLRSLEWPDAWVVAVQTAPPAAPKPAVTAPPAAGAAAYTVQVLASGSRDLARSLLRRLLEDGFAGSHIVFDEQLWKVRAGTFATREDAALQQQRVAARGYPDAWVLPLPPTR